MAQEKKLFYCNKDICEIYGICRSKANEHIQRIKKENNIDESRLPRRGLIPAKLVRDYFNQCSNGV